MSAEPPGGPPVHYVELPASLWPLPRFEPLPIRTARDAEENARRYTAYQGFPNARLTDPGPDGGVDVEADGVVAQVKAEAKPVSLAVVQRTYGIAHANKSRPAVFALAGFTPSAVKWAHDHHVALFTFDLSGAPHCANNAATEYWYGSHDGYRHCPYPPSVDWNGEYDCEIAWP